MWKLILATFFWGSSYYLNKIALSELNIYFALSSRFFLATIVLGFFYLPSKNFKQDLSYLKKDNKLILLIILFSFLTISGHYYFMYDSLNYLPAGVATIIVEAGIPLSQFVVAVLILKEKITKVQFIAIIFSILGLIFVSDIKLDTLSQGNNQTIGLLLVFISVLCMMFNLFMSKKINKKLSVLGLVFWSTSLGSIVFHLFSIKNFNSINLNEISFISWFSMIYLGIFASGLAFVWYYGSLKYYPTSLVSSISFLIPIWGFLTVLVFSEETFSFKQIIGVFITLISLWFIIKTSPSKQSKENKKRETIM